MVPSRLSVVAPRINFVTSQINVVATTTASSSSMETSSGSRLKYCYDNSHQRSYYCSGVEDEWHSVRTITDRIRNGGSKSENSLGIVGKKRSSLDTPGSLYNTMEFVVVAQRSKRSFSSLAQLRTRLSQEAEYEKGQYDKGTRPDLPEGWDYHEENENDVNLKMSKLLTSGKSGASGGKTSVSGAKSGGFICEIEWQVVPPSINDEVTPENETVDFVIKIEEKKSGIGCMFYCSSGVSHADIDVGGSDSSGGLVIGNIRSYSNLKERDSPAAYNGPEFDELAQPLQDALITYLEKDIGITESVVLFIDQTARDKEHREYMLWLSKMGTLIQKQEMSN